MTDAFYVQYRCRSILLLSAIYEYHYNIVNLIFVCFCQLANTNKNEYNHCCYLYLQVADSCAKISNRTL